MPTLTREYLYKRISSSKSSQQTKRDALNMLINKPQLHIIQLKSETQKAKKIKKIYGKV